MRNGRSFPASHTERLILCAMSSRIFRVAKAAEPGYTAAEIGAMEFAITVRRVCRADDSWMPMAPGVFLLAMAFSWNASTPNSSRRF
jgi:hypothetical protein